MGAADRSLLSGWHPAVRSALLLATLGRGADPCILRLATMIARHWTGIVKPGLVDRYVDHLRRETFPGLASLPGFVRACVLRRDVARGTEVRVVTLWQSLSAIKAFSGDEPEVAVVPVAVQAMMVDYDRRATHYEVVHAFEP